MPRKWHVRFGRRDGANQPEQSGHWRRCPYLIMEEGLAQRRGGQGRWRAGQRHDSDRRAGALGCRDRVRLQTGYDSQGRVLVNHLVDERGCSALLEKPHTTDDNPGVVRGER